MNLAFKIARRYLFAKKSTNAINVITGISVFGISIGAAALVLVLSVFNGFEELITGLFSNFNPDVKISLVKGKTFTADSSKVAKIRNLDGVESISQTLEEVAYFEYHTNEGFGKLKGVDSYFKDVTDLDSTIIEGAYALKDGDRNLLVVGGGMRNKLGVNVGDHFESMKVYMAKRRKVSFGQQFKKRFAYPVGTFKIQQDFDQQYILAGLEFVQDLLGQPDKIGALEVKLSQGADETAVIEQIKQIVGPDFYVKNRYEQDEAFLKIMNLEKWMSFAILSLTLILIAFNMIGSLWMIVLEKKKDIAILKSMGTTNNMVRNIFLYEGAILSILGLIIGFILSLSLYFIQKTYGIIGIPDGFVVNAYPVSIRLFDFIAVILVVLTIGLIASIPPALRAKRIPALIREE